MSIMKVKARGRDRYRVRYRDGESRSPLSKTFDRRREAEDFESAVRTAKQGGTQVRRASTQTLEAFGMEYVQKYANVELAAATLATHRTQWNRHVLPKLGKRTLSTLAGNPELLQDFKAALVAEGVGPPTIKRTLAVLSGVLGKAVEWNRIANNPVAAVPRPSAKRQRRIEPLAPMLVEQLREAMPSDIDRRLVAVLAYSGLRPGEALALNRSDVGARTISVCKALKLDGEGETKTSRARSVPLLAPLAEDLADLGTGLLFPGRGGLPWTSAAYRNWRRRVWQPACQTVGLAIVTETRLADASRRSYAGPRPYELRHSSASLMLHEQRNPVEIAELMGHSPQVLFSTYAHVIADLRRADGVSAEDQIRAARSAKHGR
jgi:integrase